MNLDPELDSVELVISPNFHFVERGLMITGQPSLQEWGETWETIQFFDEDILPYVIGDMLAYGEMTYGQAHAQFLKLDGQGRYTSGSLRNLKYVSSRWPLSRRRYAVPWSYYQETAGLSADKQDEVMQRLVAGGGKRNGLRSEIRQLNGGKEPNPPTNPDDTIEELRQENYQQAQRIAELEQTITMPDMQSFTTQNDYNALKQTIVNQLKKWQSMPITEFIQNINDIKNQIEWLIEWIEQHE